MAHNQPLRSYFASKSDAVAQKKCKEPRLLDLAAVADFLAIWGFARPRIRSDEVLLLV